MICHKRLLEQDYLLNLPLYSSSLLIMLTQYHQNVHYLTEESQNIEKHYVTVNARTNRISGHYLSAVSPVNGILKIWKMENVFSTILNKKHKETITSWALWLGGARAGYGPYR